MSTDIAEIGNYNVKSIPGGEIVQLKSFWQEQDTVIVFFRRWGCTLCRLWAKELSEINPVLQKHDIKLVGIGVEEEGSKVFIERKYFNGDLYHVTEQSTYQTLGFKKFSTIGILASLFWKQSRDALMKGKEMALGGDLKGDWGQTGGALLVKRGGNMIRHFVQSGPGDHLPNEEILKAFGLENEYRPESMSNKKRENVCNPEVE